jgi:hypothetical protein
MSYAKRSAMIAVLLLGVVSFAAVAAQLGATDQAQRAAGAGECFCKPGGDRAEMAAWTDGQLKMPAILLVIGASYATLFWLIAKKKEAQ